MFSVYGSPQIEKFTVQFRGVYVYGCGWVGTSQFRVVGLRVICCFREILFKGNVYLVGGGCRESVVWLRTGELYAFGIFQVVYVVGCMSGSIER